MAHPCAAPVDDSGSTKMSWSKDYHIPPNKLMGGNRSPPTIRDTQTSFSVSLPEDGSEECSWSESSPSSTSESCSPSVTVTGPTIVQNANIVLVAPQKFIYNRRRKTSVQPPSQCHDTTTDGIDSIHIVDIGDDPTEQKTVNTDGQPIQDGEIREKILQNPPHVIQSPPRAILYPEIRSDCHRPAIKKTGRCNHKSTVVLVILVISMAAAIAGVITYMQLKDLGKIYRTTGLVSVSVDDSFNASMADNSSTEFSAFSQKFCDSVGTILTGSESTSVVACTVYSLSKGSIVTTFTLDLQTTFNTSRDWLKDLLQISGVHDGEFTHWLNLRVKTSSINVASLESKLSDSTVPGPYASKVDCTQSFLPLPYTYPNFCGEYQSCTSTGIKYLRCPEGFEFSYDSSADNTACERRSENTYCGQRRREDLATTIETATRPTDTATATTKTAATTTDTKPFTDTTPVAPSTTTSVESAVTKDTTSTSLPCSVILANRTLSELFHCPPTGFVFIPRHDTYPDHCNSYVWCVDGVTYNSSKIGCGAGAHYTTMEDGPCYPVWHPNTFCQVMRRCQDLLTQIKGYTTPSTTFADMTETPG